MFQPGIHRKRRRSYLYKAGGELRHLNGEFSFYPQVVIRTGSLDSLTGAVRIENCHWWVAEPKVGIWS